MKQAKDSNDDQGGKLRVAIIGVGHCASSLVQGVQFYRDATDEDFVRGLIATRRSLP